MDKSEYQSTIRSIRMQDPRYREEAYWFVRQGLEYTVKELKKVPEGTVHHVRGQELLQGIRCYALEQFGPVAGTVLEKWGVKASEDFGEIVFNMVDFGLLGKTEQDDREDFKDVFDFHEAFVHPFLPRKTSESS